MTPAEQETIKAMDEQLARYLVDLLAKSKVPDLLVNRINPDSIVERIAKQVNDLKARSDENHRDILIQFKIEAAGIAEKLPRSLPVAADDRQIAAILLALNGQNGLRVVSQQLVAIQASLLGDEGNFGALALLNAELAGLKTKLDGIAPPAPALGAEPLAALVARLENVVSQIGPVTEVLPTAGASGVAGRGGREDARDGVREAAREGAREGAREAATAATTNSLFSWIPGLLTRKKSGPPGASPDGTDLAGKSPDEHSPETVQLDQVSEPLQAPRVGDAAVNTDIDNKEKTPSSGSVFPWRQAALTLAGLGIGAAMVLGAQQVMPPKQPPKAEQPPPAAPRESPPPQTVLDMLRKGSPPNTPVADIIVKLCRDGVTSCAALKDADALVAAKIKNAPMTEMHKLVLLQLLMAKAARTGAPAVCRQPPPASYQENRKVEVLNLLIRCLAAAPASADAGASPAEAPAIAPPRN